MKSLALSVAVVLAGTSLGMAQTPDCAEITDAASYLQAAIPKHGGAKFLSPPVVDATDPGKPYQLVARYAAGVIAGCPVELRSFNGQLTGDTLRARPGDTIYLTYTNDMPAGITSKHPQRPLIGHGHGAFSFNQTNLHTHGLHVDPVGTHETPPQFASDNVLLEIAPGATQQYRIHIPADHPSGLYWYHPHLHGATAIQVSSGMAGALLIEGGSSDNGELAVVPSIAAARRDIMVLQQIRFGADGKLEGLNKIETSLFRPTLVNGQFAPVIRLQPGEVRRLSFVHAGVEDNIQLAIDGVSLNEVAVDGISLGRTAVWPATDDVVADNGLLLSPGQRSEVLIRAPELAEGETSRTLWLRDLPLGPARSIVAATERQLRRVAGSAADGLHLEIGKPGQPLAQLVIEGPPLSMQLPTDAELAATTPTALPPPTPVESALPITQRVEFSFGYNRLCDETGYCDPATQDTCLPPAPGCHGTVYLVNDRVFSPYDVRILRAGTAERWRVSGRDATHPFHIHVNPFYLDRQERDEGGNLVMRGLWRDTLMLPADGTPTEFFTRYPDFVGPFVLHCHILNHEDRGMMQLVDIR